MNSNFKVIGLTQLGIKPESAAPKVNALTTRPFELLSQRLLRLGNTKNTKINLQTLSNTASNQKKRRSGPL